MPGPHTSIASRRSLLSFGMTPHSITRAVAHGTLIHIRRGWYATASAPDAAVRAVRAGGLATALSAASIHGLWTPPDAALHIRLPANGSRLLVRSTQLRVGDARASNNVCLHWRGTFSDKHDGVTPIIDALVDAAHCQSVERAVVVLDSALNKKLVSKSDLASAFASLPRRFRRVLALADARSQSGTETLVRLRLRALRLRVSIQVRISGVGHVDLLVGDRLVIECDSHEWHAGESSYFNDRRRDLELLALGYLPMRLTYQMVMFQWPMVERVILAHVRRRAHLWPRRSNSGHTVVSRAHKGHAT